MMNTFCQRLRRSPRDRRPAPEKLLLWLAAAGCGAWAGGAGLTGAARLQAAAPATAAPAPATPGVARTAKLPAWVAPVTADVAAVPAEAIQGQPIWHLLQDQQTNVTERTTYFHTARRVLSESGVQGGAQVSVSFDPAYQSLAFHQLVVHRAGAHLNRLPSQEIKLLQREENLERHLYDGRMTAVLILDDIRVDDVVEVAYSVRGTNPIFAGRYAGAFGTGSKEPVHQFRFRLLCPAGRRLAVRAFAGAPAAQTRALAGGLTEYRWDLDEVPARLADDQVPSWFDAYGWVQVSEYPDWNAVARWATGLFQPAATPGAVAAWPPEVRAKLQAIQSLPGGRPAQALAALRFVQDEVRYLGMEVGVNTHQPYPVATVLQHRFGDCKDKANLLCALLRQLGFDADPALVETDYRQAIAQMLPSPQDFDHAVVCLRLEGRTYWLDPTNSQQGGTLGHVFFPAYGKALLARADAVDLTDVTPCGLDESATEILDSYVLAPPPGNSRLNVRTTYRGYAADRMRATLTRHSREELQKTYLNFYAKQYGRIQPADAVQIRDDREGNVLTMGTDYLVGDLWAPGKQHPERFYADFYPMLMRVGIDLPTTRVRSMPLFLARPNRVTETVEIRPPIPITVPGERTEVRDAAFRFTYLRQASGGLVSLRYAYENLDEVVEAGRTPEYLANVQRALDKMNYSLWISRGTAAAALTRPAGPPAGPRTAGVRPAAVTGAGVSYRFGQGLGGLGTLGVVLRLLWLFFRVRRRDGGAADLTPAAFAACAVCGKRGVLGPDGRGHCAAHPASAAAVPPVAVGAAARVTTPGGVVLPPPMAAPGLRA